MHSYLKRFNKESVAQMLGPNWRIYPYLALILYISFLLCLSSSRMLLKRGCVDYFEMCGT